jgi:hypothetical protein
LRKAYVVARKLKITDFEEWIHKELNGYPETVDEIPQYREVSGEVKGWNPVRGWIPVIFENPKLTEKISNIKIIQPVTELENLSCSRKQQLILYQNP